MAVVFVFLNLLMIFSSHLAADGYFKSTHLSGHLINTFLLYITQVSVSVLFLGAIVKNLDILYVMLLNSMISLAVIVALRKSIKPSISNSYHKLTGFSKYIFKSKDYFLYLFVFLFALQVIVTLMKIDYLPPHVGDVFSYHLHPLVEWFQQGEILSYTDTPVWRANENPLGTKVIHLWFVMFLGDITWIEIPQFLFGLLLSLISYSLMLKLNIRKNSALRYAVLIYFIPAVLLQSRTCQDHLVFAACILWAVFYFVNIIYDQQYKLILPLFIVLSLLFGIKKHSVLVIFALFLSLLLSRRFNGRRIMTFIKTNWFEIALGSVIMMGGIGYFIIMNQQLYEELWYRYSGIFFTNILLPLALALLIFFFLRYGFKKFKVWEFFKKRPLLPAIAVGLILLYLSAIVIKNRNFLKPFFLGHKSPVMVTNRDFSLQYPDFNSKIMKNLLAFPFRIKDIGLYTPYTPDLLEKSGFGIQFFAFGLIAYILAVPLFIFKKAYRNSVMGFILIFSLLLLLVYFMVYFSWANYRSFIFFGVIGMISWAFILEKSTLPTYYLRYIDVLMVLMILFNGITCFFEGNTSARQWKTLFTIDNPADRTTIKYSSLINKSKERESWKFIDQYVRPEQHMGFSSGEAAWTFPYFDHQLKRRIYFLNNLPGFKPEPREKNGKIYQMLKFTPDFKASLKQRGVRFIHLSTRGTPHRLRIFMPEGIDDIYKVTDKLYYFKWSP
ncbi:MAG: glycosyltransferase family 39 protein [Candidatus Aminicenantes bacterium]|jgi:hypothetical protein